MPAKSGVRVTVFQGGDARGQGAEPRFEGP